MLAGYSRPRIDNIMMRIVDIIYAYPTLILIILLQVFLTALAQKNPEDMRPLEQLFVNLDQNSGGLFFVFVAIGAVSWLNMARLMRGQVMHYKEQEFVQAAHIVGANDRRIMGRHLLPNAIGPCIVAETLAIPTYICHRGLSQLYWPGCPAADAQLGQHDCRRLRRPAHGPLADLLPSPGAVADYARLQLPG